jgi:hypothetical protein
MRMPAPAPSDRGWFVDMRGPGSTCRASSSPEWTDLSPAPVRWWRIRRSRHRQPRRSFPGHQRRSDRRWSGWGVPRGAADRGSRRGEDRGRRLARSARGRGRGPSCRPARLHGRTAPLESPKCLGGRRVAQARRCSLSLGLRDADRRRHLTRQEWLGSFNVWVWSRAAEGGGYAVRLTGLSMAALGGDRELSASIHRGRTIRRQRSRADATAGSRRRSARPRLGVHRPPGRAPVQLLPVPNEESSPALATVRGPDLSRSSFEST